MRSLTAALRRQARPVLACRRLQNDCTGQPLTCDAAVADELDESIHNLITYDGRNTEFVKTTFAKDPTNPMVMIVAALEIQRHGPIEGIDQKDLLRSLDKMQLAGKLSTREALLSAGVLASAEQQHGLSGLLFETAVQHTPTDILALRLAHDGFISAGWSSDSLGCLLRHRGVYLATPNMICSVHGMAAQGNVENGHYAIAKELAEKACGMNRRSKDVTAVTALLTAQVLTGQSSEAIAAFGESKTLRRHGELFWQLPLGMAYVLRGNCNASFKGVRSTVDADSECAQVASSVAMHLWHILLHIGPLHILPVDYVCEHLQKGLRSLQGNQLHPLVQTVAHCANLLALLDDNVSDMVDYRKVNALNYHDDSKEQSIWSFLKPASTSTLAADRMEASLKHREQKDALIAAARSTLDAWMKALPAAVMRDYTTTMYPSLRKVQPALRFLSDPQTMQAQALSRQQALLSVCQAMVHYTLEDYTSTCKLLFQGYKSGFQGIGLTAAQRSVLTATFLEALIRTDDMATAVCFFEERVALFPNDGQAWRKLGHIYRTMGRAQQADDADYTAWQLGIGQGGFGGNI